MKRRKFFTGTIAGAAGLTAASCTRISQSDTRDELFRFVHFTDVHMRPERGAPEGFARAVAAINACEPDFVVGGGDMIDDALAVDEARAVLEYDLYEEHRARFDMPVHEVIGNHEVFGITAPGLVRRDHPDWGKELFRHRLGNGATWRSFDHKGVHFVLLDTIGIEPDGDASRYFGEIGANSSIGLPGTSVRSP